MHNTVHVFNNEEQTEPDCTKTETCKLSLASFWFCYDFKIKSFLQKLVQMGKGKQGLTLCKVWKWPHTEEVSKEIIMLLSDGQMMSRPFKTDHYIMQIKEKKIVLKPVINDGNVAQTASYRTCIKTMSNWKSSAPPETSCGLFTSIMQYFTKMLMNKFFYFWETWTRQYLSLF